MFWATEAVEARKTAEFKPDLTPDQLRERGVYDSVYAGTKPRLASMETWKPEWIHPQDPMGWLQWYERYSQGRRTEDDARQIARWQSFKARHGAQFSENPTPRRAYALQNWAIDPLSLVAPEKRDEIHTQMDTYANAIAGH
jgi:hypothetical protein